MSRIPTPTLDTATGPTAEVYAQINKAAGKVPNTFAPNLLTRSGLLREDLDYHLVRASMVIIFLFFGYQKWFEYEAQVARADYRHAAFVALRHCAAASDRKIRSVDRETRWRWRLKVLWTAA